MAKKKQTRHRSALKAYRQSVKRNLRNRELKKKIRLAGRAITDAAAAKDAAQVAQLTPAAMSAIDKAAKTGTIHWKTAARRKARLAARAAAQLAAAKA